MGPEMEPGMQPGRRLKGPSPSPKPLLSNYNLFCAVALATGPGYWSWPLVLASGPGDGSWLLVLATGLGYMYQLAAPTRRRGRRIIWLILQGEDMVAGKES